AGVRGGGWRGARLLRATQRSVRCAAATRWPRGLGPKHADSTRIARVAPARGGGRPLPRRPWLAVGGVRVAAAAAPPPTAPPTGKDLANAHLRGAHLAGANLVRADLDGSDLQGADLRRA